MALSKCTVKKLLTNKWSNLLKSTALPSRASLLAFKIRMGILLWLPVKWMLTLWNKFMSLKKSLELILILTLLKVKLLLIYQNNNKVRILWKKNQNLKIKKRKKEDIMENTGEENIKNLDQVLVPVPVQRIKNIEEKKCSKVSSTIIYKE